MSTVLIEAISFPRFETYRRAAGFDDDLAMRLYIWNAEIGAAFHLPIQAVEVALRNCISATLERQFGLIWWTHPEFQEITAGPRIVDIDVVLKRLRHMRKPAISAQVVASLSFGFWVGMLSGRHNPQIWSRHLKSTFPFAPADTGRKDIERSARDVASFRNRISHHEPLIRQDISGLYGTLLRLLDMINPDKGAFVRRYSSVPLVIRQRPGRRAPGYESFDPGI